MRTTPITLTILLAAATVVAAHTPDTTANCDVALEAEEADYQVDLPDGVATVYVLTPEQDIAQLWLESNEVEGLQTHPHDCRLSPSHQQTTVDADTRVL